MNDLEKEIIYLDHNATTPASSDVQAHVFLLMDQPSNASSLHEKGRDAKNLIETSRKTIMGCLGINHLSHDLVFTSSGTEANNTVLRSFEDYHLFISKIEHASLIKIAEKFNEVTFLDVDANGVVGSKYLEKALKNCSSDKKLVSIASANGETGVVQDIKELARIAHEEGAIFHSDMVQSFGKLEVSLRDLDVDLATISSHKIGGIVGAAALVKKAHIQIKPLIIGGGQERGMRAGTENTYAISAFGKASGAIDKTIEKFKEIAELRDYLESQIMKFVPNAKIYSKDAERLPNTSCISMPGVPSNVQLINFDIRRICVSIGSACSSGVTEESHVLRAMCLNNPDNKNTIRVSLGVNTTEEEIESLIEAWKDIYTSVSVKNNKIIENSYEQSQA